MYKKFHGLFTLYSDKPAILVKYLLYLIIILSLLFTMPIAQSIHRGFFNKNAVFDNILIIGTVFDDRNGNGIQDDGDVGVAGVTIINIDGAIIITDQLGRFHFKYAQSEHYGQCSYLMLKIVPQSLPQGTIFTTANPLVKPVIFGFPIRFDFGVQLPRD